MQRRDEDKLQAALWDLIQLRKQPGVLAWAVCNNPRSAPDGARLKRLGMLPGVPDLHFLVPGGRYHTLEVKTLKGRPNPNQIAWMSNLNATGATADICRGWDDCVNMLILRNLIKPGVYGRFFSEACVSRTGGTDDAAPMVSMVSK